MSRFEAAFPRPAVGSELVGEQDGMSLRDWFATTIDKDEYGDIISRNLPRETAEHLAGPYPKEPANPTDFSRPATPEQRIRWRLDCLAWEFRVRAALRYMMADAMIEARSK